MPQAAYVQDGCVIDYTPTADLAAGEVVVQGDLVGVSKQEIKANKLGSLAVDGVFDFTKLTTVAFTLGTTLYWDDAANVATATSAGNKLLGKVVRAAATTDPTVRVRLFQ
jgi:predicted RecA/RadA family phage recombinase